MKLAFIYNSNSYFTKLDLQIFQDGHDVVPLFFNRKKEAIFIWRYMKTLRCSDVLVCWFASWHSILPLLYAKVSNKPFVLIGGGYDSANVPQAQYGNQRIWWKRMLSNFCFRSADRLIVNSHFIKNEIMEIGGVNEENMRVIYHGIPIITEKIEVDEKGKIALNVGNLSKQNELRKGIRPFIQTAGLLKAWRFVHAGKWKDDSHKALKALATSNVHFEGFVSDERLKELFQRASVYVQPSLHEGFGLSVIEAMQRGCIPVVSAEGALPEVVGEYGVILEDLRPQTIASAIELAENKFQQRRDEIQQYVHKNFDLKIRAMLLLKVIEEIDQ